MKSVQTLFIATLLLASLGSGSGSTFTVISTDDSGTGTLRQAILDANASPGADTITFNIPGGGVQSIAPVTGLPAITDPVTIDGYTQPGASPNTLPEGENAVWMIELRGDQCPDYTAQGLDLHSDNCVVRGLVINRWVSRQLYLHDAKDCVIEGNRIGLSPEGTEIPNPTQGGWGVWLIEASRSRIGGTTPAARNLIAGARQAPGQGMTAELVIYSLSGERGGNTVQGNFIGLDRTGTSGITPFNNYGLEVLNSPDNFIGGAMPGARNVISGFGGGILINRT